MSGNATQIRSVFRWAGSKRQLLPILERYWRPSFERYVEPFAGSSSLFYRLLPSQALLADKNAELIETYGVLRSRPKALYEAASSLAPTKAIYRSVRQLRCGDLTKLERAARFVFLNRNCFNGIFRTNVKGEFNVPFAGDRQGEMPDLEEFRACARALKAASIRAWDFGTTLRHCRRGDFVYLDPPYLIGARRVFRHYGPRPFGPEDLKRLKLHLEALEAKGAAFVLSYADSTEARDIAKGWNSRRVRVRRNVAGFAGARRHTYELLVSNIEVGRQ